VPRPFPSCPAPLTSAVSSKLTAPPTRRGPRGLHGKPRVTLRHVSDSRAALGPHVGGSGVDLPLGGIPNSSGGARRNPNGPAIECSLNFLPRFSWVAIAVRAVAGGVCRWWGLRFAPSGSEDNGGAPCAVPALCEKWGVSGPPPMAGLTAVRTVFPYAGLLGFLLNPKTRTTLFHTENCRIAVYLCCFCLAAVCFPVVGAGGP